MLPEQEGLPRAGRWQQGRQASLLEADEQSPSHQAFLQNKRH